MWVESSEKSLVIGLLATMPLFVKTPTILHASLRLHNFAATGVKRSRENTPTAPAPRRTAALYFSSHLAAKAHVQTSRAQLQ